MEFQQVIYKSEAVEELNPSEILYLKDEIKKLNHDRLITGILLFDGFQFLQILEGEKIEVENLYKKIIKDQRHRNVTLILNEPIPVREFSSWNMQVILKEPERLEKIIEEMEVLGEFLKVGEKGESFSSFIENYYSNNNEKSKSPSIIKSFLVGSWDSNGKRQEAINKFKIGKKELSTKKTFNYSFAFQPIINIKENSIDTVEALIRGENGESPSNIFHGLSLNETHKVDLESKLSAISIYSELKCNASLALNFLPSSLISRPGVIQEIRYYSEENLINPEKIIIEVTEQQAIGNYDEFLGIVDQIRANGMGFVIDDFGAGYAGLSMLVDFQPHKLKIDRAIVQGVSHDGPRQAIVLAIVEFASRLGIKIIAEGVENPEDVHWLTSIGILDFQGYYFAKPSLMSIPEVNI